MPAKEYPLHSPPTTSPPASDAQRIWAFDLGKASIGEAVREGNRFLHVASLLIPAEFADTKPAAARRRMMRTRQAHRARERWLEQVWKAAGLEVHPRMQPRSGDRRLETRRVWGRAVGARVPGSRR